MKWILQESSYRVMPNEEWFFYCAKKKKNTAFAIQNGILVTQEYKNSFSDDWEKVDSDGVHLMLLYYAPVTAYIN